jgi:hypothetical protein
MVEKLRYLAKLAVALLAFIVLTLGAWQIDLALFGGSGFAMIVMVCAGLCGFDLASR